MSAGRQPVPGFIMTAFGSGGKFPMPAHTSIEIESSLTKAGSVLKSLCDYLTADPCASKGAVAVRTAPREEKDSGTRAVMKHVPLRPGDVSILLRGFVEMVEKNPSIWAPQNAEYLAWAMTLHIQTGVRPVQVDVFLADEGEPGSQKYHVEEGVSGFEGTDLIALLPEGVCMDLSTYRMARPKGGDR